MLPEPPPRDAASESVEAGPAPAQQERVRRVAERATLVSVLLKELHAERADQIAQTEVRASHLANVGFAIRDLGLHVTVRLRLTTEPATYSIDATFNLHYGLADAIVQEDAEAFAQTNAVFNIWPYWREIVQSTTTRMAVAAPAVPLLRI